MRSALAYRPRRRPLQLASPGAAAAYLAALVLASFFFSNPLILVAITAAGCLAGGLAGVGPAVRLALKLGIVLIVLMTLVNGLVTSRGATVLLRLGEWPLLGQVDVTAESLLAGAVIGLRATAITVLLAVYSAAVDPDRVLRALRPFAGRSALTASLIARLVPVAIGDASRLSEAARLRGPAAAPVGRAELVRRLLAGSLDRSVDVAATLELRGYGLPSGRVGRVAERRSRHDRRFLTVAGAVLFGSALALALGAGGFEAFPRIEVASDPATLATAAGLLAAGLAPIQLGGAR